jgi:hypothetical protein
MSDTQTVVKPPKHPDQAGSAATALGSISNATQQFIADVLTEPPSRGYRLDDYDAIRDNLFDNVKTAVTRRFPLRNSRYALTVEDLDYDDPAEIGVDEEKRLLLENKSGVRRLRVATGIANWFRARAFKKKLQAAKNSNLQELRRLIRLSNSAKVPVYIQSGGTPLGNAYYADFGVPTVDWGPGITWKDALTGRSVRMPKDKAVFIGKGYNKLPVIAHELGHASDLNENTWSTKAGAALDVVQGLSLATAMLAAHPDAVDKGVSPLVGIIGGAGLLAASTLSSMLSKRDERAASDRAIQSLRQLQKEKQLNKSLELLVSAYKTYDPLSIGTPDFGSNKYAKAALPPLKAK